MKFEEAFPIQEVYRGERGERDVSHERSSWLGSAAGAAKSLAGAEPAAMAARACEKRGRKAGDDRKVEAVEEKYRSCGIGELVITSF